MGGRKIENTETKQKKINIGSDMVVSHQMTSTVVHSKIQQRQLGNCEQIGSALNLEYSLQLGKDLNEKRYTNSRQNFIASSSTESNVLPLPSKEETPLHNISSTNRDIKESCECRTNCTSLAPQVSGNKNFYIREIAGKKWVDSSLAECRMMTTDCLSGTFPKT